MGTRSPQSGLIEPTWSSKNKAFYKKHPYFCLLLKIRCGETGTTFPSDHKPSCLLQTIPTSFSLPVSTTSHCMIPKSPSGSPSILLTLYSHDFSVLAPRRSRGACESCYQLLSLAHKEVLGNEHSFEDVGQQTRMTHKTSFKYYRDLK